MKRMSRILGCCAEDVLLCRDMGDMCGEQDISIADILLVQDFCQHWVQRKVHRVLLTVTVQVALTTASTLIIATT